MELRAKYPQQPRGYSCGLHRWALRSLKESRWAAVPTDKDGGFALAKKTDLKLALENLVQNHHYVQMHINPQGLGAACNRHAKLAQAASEELHDPQLAHVLCREIKRNGSRSILSKLQCTCKTHKDSGSVSF